MRWAIMVADNNAIYLWIIIQEQDIISVNQKKKMTQQSTTCWINLHAVVATKRVNALSH